MDKPYKPKENLQSLLGYGLAAHKASRGTCQYCQYGIKKGMSSDMQFDIWRQLTVEHLITERDGGYLHETKSRKNFELQVRRRFPTLSDDQVEAFIDAINEANTFTACSRCNSMTSRDGELQNKKKIHELLDECPGNPEEVFDYIKGFLATIRERRQKAVEHKLEETKKVFLDEVEKELRPLPSK